MKTAHLDNTSLTKRTGLGESQSLDQAFVIVISTGPVTLHNFHIKIHTEEIYIIVSFVASLFFVYFWGISPGKDYTNFVSFVRI